MFYYQLVILKTEFTFGFWFTADGEGVPFKFSHIWYVNKKPITTFVLEIIRPTNS